MKTVIITIMDCKTRNMNQDFADEFVRLCVNFYDKLPKSGKPTDSEWTVIAAVIEYSNRDVRVVSFGTGSKCLGRNLLSSSGDLVHDAHAEVIARRGFLLYLYSEIERLYRTGSSSVLCIANDNVQVKCDVQFAFVVSSVPCGDAAIMPMLSKDKPNEVGNDNEVIPPKKARLTIDDTISETINEEFTDIHRTGGKCIDGENQDPKLPGCGYHVLGAVRTKPGRGDPTDSVSCSDKLARWNAVGVQGALLSLIIKDPIFFSTIIIGGETPFCSESLERAINKRIGCPAKVTFLQSQVPFSIIRSTSRTRPAPSGIAWNLGTNCVQVCVKGNKMGATKSKPGNVALDISKRHLMKRFLDIASEINCEIANVNQISYRELKNLSHAYQKNWQGVVEKHLRSWTKKPVGLEEFKLVNI